MAKTTGKRLRQLREDHNLKQREAAKLADILDTKWSEFERGKRLITLDPAIRLRERFGLTLDWIYFGHTAKLGVTKQTISTDLKDIVQPLNNVMADRGKGALGRKKSPGRPKGARRAEAAPNIEKVQEAVDGHGLSPWKKLLG
jgi:transcriptional regulator with XRE-family HTH domain